MLIAVSSRKTGVGRARTSLLSWLGKASTSRSSLHYWKVDTRIRGETSKARFDLVTKLADGTEKENCVREPNKMNLLEQSNCEFLVAVAGFIGEQQL